MNSDIEIGQVLSLKIRFNNDGIISRCNHPYLVIDVDEKLNVIEIAQLDSIEGKQHRVFKWGNLPVFSNNPKETVIDKDSYIQMDNILKIENFKELERFRRQKDKLSSVQLSYIISSYNLFHKIREIDEMKNVYMDKNEIMSLNT